MLTKLVNVEGEDVEPGGENPTATNTLTNAHWGDSLTTFCRLTIGSARLV